MIVMQQSERVNIRPEVQVLSLLKHIEYEAWYALAEFVDNALASYLKSEQKLKAVEGADFKLNVSIEFNDQESKIIIRDNAAGIHQNDFTRAFRAAEVPPDNTGLSEFGVGMKSAACWFSDYWQVTTKALGEDYEKVVCFDLRKIFEEKLEELDVLTTGAETLHHYTVIELYGVKKIPRGKGIWKVKDHLKSIYRDFIRSGQLILKVAGEELTYTTPKILNFPRYDKPESKSVLWRKEIDFQIDEGLRVHGFVAIREKASTSEAGFALFRRGRVIEGSHDSGFRPQEIFGPSNSFRYQRIFGELHLEGFNVNFTKKGIQWDENLDIFLSLLKDDLSHEDFPLLQQAEKYRARASEIDYQKTTKALDNTTNDFRKNLPGVMSELSRKKKPDEPNEVILPSTKQSIHREFSVRVNDIDWNIKIELSYDPSLKNIVEIGNHLINNNLFSGPSRLVGVRLSLIHPFMVQFIGTDNSKIEPMLRIVAALGLSEVLAKESGVKTQGEVRRNFNEIINHLSKSYHYA